MIVFVNALFNVTLLFLLSFNLIFADIKPDTSSTQKLQKMIDKILKNHNFRRVDCGIQILSADKKDVLYSLNEKELLPPASTMKILTVATALEKLQSKFLFRTIIFSDSRPKNGVIQGNIYLKGYGNPIFSEDDLGEMVKTLKSQGILAINGDIIADESYFDDLYKRTEWAGKDEEDEEEPPISALSLNRNYLTVLISSGQKKNKSPEISVYPPLSNIKVINRAKTAILRKRNKGKLHVNASISTKGIIIEVSGLSRLNSNQYRSVHMTKPGLFTGFVLKHYLSLNGIKMNGTVKTGKIIGVKNELTRHEIGLDSIARLTNKHSDNFLADYLLKILGAELKGSPGHAKFGKEIVANYLKENGIETTQFNIYDGSGLSRKNKLSAETLSKILLQISKKKQLFERFVSTLPIAGIDGTLRGRMRDTKAESNARAKTGTLSNVTSLAGYVRSADNELLIFSIIMSELRRGRRKYKNYEDEIVELLSEFSRINFQSEKFKTKFN
jgi:PBP4 family serine-type D-alanyl-D-alanine carboxypeptidase